MEGRFFCRSKDGNTLYTTDGKFIYAERDGKLHRLDLFDGHYYKLRPWNGIPILEIDGLRMQLVRDFATPLDYAKAVVKALRLPSSGDAALLDTCMGLGYTALEAAKREGISKVVTCELSDAVITLAKWNPFSQGLFEGDKMDVRHGSVASLIKEMPGSSFDFVIHDPPRFSHAPELYSSDFYVELLRVSKKKARIFHYCGSLGKKKGKDIAKATMERMADAGFRRLEEAPLLQGVLARAP